MNGLVRSLASPYDDDLSVHCWKDSRLSWGRAAPLVGDERAESRHNGADRSACVGAPVRIPVLRRMLVRGMKAAKKPKGFGNLRITKALKTPTESAT